MAQLESPETTDAETALTGIFAERRLVLRGVKDQNITVQFGPVIREGNAAFCRFRIYGTNGELTRDIWGSDDVQAVELAMRMAGSDLDRIAQGGTYWIHGDESGESGHFLPRFSVTSETAAQTAAEEAERLRHK